MIKKTASHNDDIGAHVMLDTSLYIHLLRKIDKISNNIGYA
jgi:hypothetical protein